MTPDSVSDYDVWRLRHVAHSGVFPISYWRMLFQMFLSRPVSVEEAHSIIGRLNGLGPVAFEDSWACITRTTGDNFWRNQV